VPNEVRRTAGTILTVPETNEKAPDWALMSDRVVADAKRLYGSLVNDVVLEQLAREATAEIWTDSIKVTHFVPVLALRTVREKIAKAGELTSLQQVAQNRALQIDA
jgi:hypothetical protein